MSKRVTIEITDGIADVKLSRPEKLNALDLPMLEALINAGAELHEDRSLRCVVLSGAGRGFSAGLDVASFAAMAGARDTLDKFLEPLENSPANRAQQVSFVWTTLPVPVIAAVHGVCFGGGLQIALGADMRLVAPDARLSVMEIKWGLIPDMSGSQTLRHLVGLDVAKDLTFTGREISGEEALHLGLATRVVAEPYAAALELARDIAGRSPDAIRAAKRLLNESVLLDRKAGLRLEANLQRSLIGTPNQLEAVMANIQKRSPSFADPTD